MSKDPVFVARSRVARASQRGAKPHVLTEARRDLSAAHVERAIRKALDAAPPLSNLQRERLAELLTGGVK